VEQFVSLEEYRKGEFPLLLTEKAYQEKTNDGFSDTAG
jgi:hypothetical protein